MEAVHLAGFSVAEAEKFFGRPPIALRRMEALMNPMSSQDAQDLFLKRFGDIDSQMDLASG